MTSPFPLSVLIALTQLFIQWDSCLLGSVHTSLFSVDGTILTRSLASLSLVMSLSSGKSDFLVMSHTGSVPQLDLADPTVPMIFTLLLCTALMNSEEHCCRQISLFVSTSSP